MDHLARERGDIRSESEMYKTRKREMRLCYKVLGFVDR